MKTLGISGLVGGVAYVTGDRFGPSSLFIPGLGGRAARGPSYVVFRDEATVYAQSGDTGTIEFQGSATSVLESIADTLSDRGGQIFVRSGEYALSQTFPAGDPGPTLLTGEGRSTSFRNGGQAFDTIELDKIEARDLSFEDLNGVPCYTGISTSVVSRISQSVPLNLRGGRILPNSEVKRLGDYIRVRTTAPGSFPAISTGAAVFNRMTADRSLRVRATVRLAPTSKSAVPFFAEPYKGDFENFLGFLWDPPNLFMITRRDGAETSTPRLLSAELMEGDHDYEIEYRQDAVRFYFDDSFLVEHTTNISPPPHEWSAAEPNGTAMSCYLKQPFFELATV